MTTQGIKYGMILLTGLLLVIMSNTVVPSEPVVKCYNDTDGDNSICFLAEPSRDTRLRQWSAASNHCRTLNSTSATLPIINSTLEQFQLTEFLLENDYTLDSAWLGVHGFSSGWTWVDQTNFTGSLNTTYLGLNVASIGQRINGNETVATLFEDNMDFTAAGYICQFKDRLNCTKSDAGANVGHVVGSSCFALYDDSIGWYLARNKCLMRHGDLAILPDSTPSGIDSMLTGLKYKPSDKQNEIKRYWVGLRKVWWKKISDGEEMKTVFLRDSSTLEDKTNAQQNCLAVDYKQQFAWSIRNCSVPLQTICQSGSYPVIAPTPPSADSSSPTQTVSLPVWAVGLICGLAGLIYIVSLIVVGIICCKCCGNKNSKQSGEDNEGGLRQRNSYTPGPKVVNTLPPPPSRMARTNEEDIGDIDNYDYPEGEFDEDYEVPIDQRTPARTEYANHEQMGRPPGRGRPR